MGAVSLWAGVPLSQLEEQPEVLFWAELGRQATTVGSCLSRAAVSWPSGGMRELQDKEQRLIKALSGTISEVPNNWFSHGVSIDPRHPWCHWRGVCVHSWDSDAAIELIRWIALPLINVYRRRDRGAVVGDVSLEGTVHEQVVFLRLPNARSGIVIQLGHLEDIDSAFKVQLMPEGHEATKGGSLSSTVSAEKRAM